MTHQSDQNSSTGEQPPPPQISDITVRITGVVIVAAGIFLTTLTDYVIEHTVPAPWLGYCGIFVGVLLILFPAAFRDQFAARFGRSRR